MAAPGKEYLMIGRVFFQRCTSLKPILIKVLNPNTLDSWGELQERSGVQMSLDDLLSPVDILEGRGCMDLEHYGLDLFHAFTAHHVVDQLVDSLCLPPHYEEFEAVSQVHKVDVGDGVDDVAVLVLHPMKEV